MKKILLSSLLLILTACSPAVIPLPTATNTNTPIPSPTLTPIPPTVTPVPNGPCDNPLLPLATGNQWTYRVTAEDGESLYTLKTLDRDDGRAIVINVEFTDGKNNVSVVEPVVCMDGAIENFPLFVISMYFSNYLRDDFNTYHDTGIYAQDYRTLVENNWAMKWDLEYLTEDYVHLKNPMGGSDLVVMQSSFIHLIFETDGTHEAVTVPAGSFPQALKVSHGFSFPITLTLPTGGTGGVLMLDTTQWIEPYVGLIRAQVDTATLSYNDQTSNFPIVSTIELIEFIRGE